LIAMDYGPLAGKLLAIAVPLIALLVVVISGRRSRRVNGSDYDLRIRTVYLIALGCVIPLLAGSLAWMHYYALCTPLILLTFRPAENQDRHDGLFLKFAIGAIAIILMSQPELISQGIWLGDPIASAQRLNGATIALFVLGLIELQRIGKPRRPPLESFFSGEPAHATSNLR